MSLSFCRWSVFPDLITSDSTFVFSGMLIVNGSDFKLRSSRDSDGADVTGLGLKGLWLRLSLSGLYMIGAVTFSGP